MHLMSGGLHVAVATKRWKLETVAVYLHCNLRSSVTNDSIVTKSLKIHTPNRRVGPPGTSALQFISENRSNLYVFFAFIAHTVNK